MFYVKTSLFCVSLKGSLLNLEKNLGNNHWKIFHGNSWSYIMKTCVCVCVFIFFHREGFFRLQDVQDILEGTDQRSCVVNISWLRYAKFHHRCIWKCHISPRKTKTPAALLLERKRYDITRSAKRWYVYWYRIKYSL